MIIDWTGVWPVRPQKSDELPVSQLRQLICKEFRDPFSGTFRTFPQKIPIFWSSDFFWRHSLSHKPFLRGARLYLLYWRFLLDSRRLQIVELFFTRKFELFSEIICKRQKLFIPINWDFTFSVLPNNAIHSLSLSPPASSPKHRNALTCFTELTPRKLRQRLKWKNFDGGTGLKGAAHDISASLWLLLPKDGWEIRGFAHVSACVRAHFKRAQVPPP